MDQPGPAEPPLSRGLLLRVGGLVLLIVGELLGLTIRFAVCSTAAGLQAPWRGWRMRPRSAVEGGLGKRCMHMTTNALIARYVRWFVRWPLW
jgi:hypothetical protein